MMNRRVLQFLVILVGSLALSMSLCGFKSPVDLSAHQKAIFDRMAHEQKDKPSRIDPVDSQWARYTNHRLGFSMDMPKAVCGVVNPVPEVPLIVDEPHELDSVYVQPAFLQVPSSKLLGYGQSVRGRYQLFPGCSIFLLKYPNIRSASA